MAASSPVSSSLCATNTFAHSRNHPSICPEEIAFIACSGSSDSFAQSRRKDRRIPMLREFRVELQQGDRRARHLQTRDVIAHEIARDVEPGALRDLRRFSVNNIKLD